MVKRTKSKYSIITILAFAFAVIFTSSAQASDAAFNNTEMALIGIGGVGVAIGIGTLIASNKSNNNSQETTLVSISVTPSTPYIKINGTQQFIATGTYSDGSTKNITSLAAWSSSNIGVATISSSGLATALTATGNTVITASLGAINSQSTLTVVVSAVFAGNSQGLVYSNNTLLQGPGPKMLDGSYVFSVTIDGSRNVYAGTYNGNVWKHAAGAAASDPWIKLVGSNGSLDILDGSCVNSVEIIDTSGDIYVGTQDGNLWEYKAGAWILVSSLYQFTHVYSVAGVLDTPDVYVCVLSSDHKVWGLDNVGTWVDMGITDVSSIAEGNLRNIYAGTQNGEVWEYQMIRDTWERLGTGSLDGTSVQSIAKDSSGNVYAGTQGGKVWKYTAATSTWSDLGLSWTGSVNSVATDGNGNIYAGTEHGNVWQYTGIWNNLVFLSWPDVINSVATDSNGNVYAGTDDGDVWEYTGTWIQLGPTSLDGTAVNSVATDSRGNAYAGTENGSVWEYTVGTWIQLGSGLTAIYSVATDSSGNVYVGTCKVWKYTAGAWVQLGSGLLDGGMVFSVAIDSSGNVYAGTNSGKMWKHMAGAAASDPWIQLTGLEVAAVNSVAIDNSGTVYVGTQSGNVWKYMAGTWIQLGTSPIDSSSVLSIAIDSSGNVYAGMRSGNVWKRTATGDVWIKLAGSGSSGTLDGSDVNSVATDSSGNVYAGTTGTSRGNVWKYSGSSWTNLNYGSETSILSVAVF
ncbi:conserved membrane hypothetical protein [Gammaproteobacteria bacterium]